MSVSGSSVDLEGLASAVDEGVTNLAQTLHTVEVGVLNTIALRDRRRRAGG